MPWSTILRIPDRFSKFSSVKPLGKASRLRLLDKIVTITPVVRMPVRYNRVIAPVYVKKAVPFPNMLSLGSVLYRYRTGIVAVLNWGILCDQHV